jgi:hypothetical protein
MYTIEHTCADDFQRKMRAPARRYRMAVRSAVDRRLKKERPLARLG